VSDNREMTPLETSLFEWALQVEQSLRKDGHSLADAARLGLYWRIIEAQQQGVDVSPAVNRLKQTLRKEL
jgi:hypothetical protein